MSNRRKYRQKPGRGSARPSRGGGGPMHRPTQSYVATQSYARGGAGGRGRGAGGGARRGAPRPAARAVRPRVAQPFPPASFARQKKP